MSDDELLALMAKTGAIASSPGMVEVSVRGDLTGEPLVGLQVEVVVHRIADGLTSEPSRVAAVERSMVFEQDPASGRLTRSSGELSPPSEAPGASNSERISS
jgi:hypothetical protein